MPRAPLPPRRLARRVRFEPNRLAGAALAAAYERVAPFAWGRRVVAPEPPPRLAAAGEPERKEAA